MLSYSSLLLSLRGVWHAAKRFRVGLVALIAIAFIGCMWAVLPWLVKQQVEQRGSHLLGRQVSVGSVEFRPWSLTLALNQLAVAHAHGQVADDPAAVGNTVTDIDAPQFYIERVSVDADISSLWRLAPVIDEISVLGPRVQLRQFADGRLDIDDLMLRIAQQPHAPSSEPMRFALHNVSVSDGKVTVNDDKAARVHVLKDLRLAVPFISNIPADREVTVLPHLGFELNGARFDTQAQTLPFADSHKTQANLKVLGLDITPYLPYVNPLLPFTLRSGVIGLDMQFAFDQKPEPKVILSGQLNLAKVHLSSHPAGADVAVEGVAVRLLDVRPLERVVQLDTVDIRGLALSAERQADGGLPWLAHSNATQASTPVSSRTAGEHADGAAWRVGLKQLTVTGGMARWTDAALSPTYRIELQHIGLTAKDLTWPSDVGAKVDASAELVGAGKPASLRVQGVVGTRQSQLTATVADFNMATVSPYLAARLRPRLEGRVAATARLDWSQPPGQTPNLGVLVDALTLDSWRLGSASAPLAQVDQVAVRGARIDVAQRTVQVASVNVRSPRGVVERANDGRWMFEQWVVPAAQSDVVRASDAPPWRVAVNALAVQAGSLGFVDGAVPRPVSVDVRGLDLSVKNLAFPSNQPAELMLSARVGSGALEAGSLSVKGSLGMQPSAFNGQLNARRLPVHALAPYAAGKLRVDLLRADASYAGSVAYQQTLDGPVLKLIGDVSLEDVRANTLGGTSAAAGPVGPASALIAPPRGGLRVGNELLSWKTLSVRGVDVNVAPQTRTRLAVKEAVLSDFFARLLIRDTGRINLQDIIASSEDSASSPSSDASTPLITVGPVSLVNGSMYFSDRFIQPNYAADLTELTGRLGGFTSEASADGTVALADLVLRGRAEGTASLDIAGQLNPLAKPLALDIQGKVRDLELPPLTPYAIKYAGHGIERGKLSLDVGYQIKPDGHLSATNRLVLNQLTFSEKVEGAKASLPVKLAVALLADRHGVIDLELPITGSLNDPQFSLGSVIFKVIGNVIGKALTAPFSLLGKAFSGIAHSAETTTVQFVAGSARLTPEAREQLTHTAQALVDKPDLQLTVSGAANLDAEREALQRERLASQLRAERRRQALSTGQVLPTDDGGAVPAELHEALLREVYKRADIPKPRNLLGVAKDLPLSDMESLLLANLPATEQGVRQLAQARAVAVRDTLLAMKVRADQLFLGPTKTDMGKDKWMPHAELGLAMR